MTSRRPRAMAVFAMVSLFAAPGCVGRPRNSSDYKLAIVEIHREVDRAGPDGRRTLPYRLLAAYFCVEYVEGAVVTPVPRWQRDAWLREKEVVQRHGVPERTTAFVEALAACLKDQDADARWMAVDSLIHIGPWARAAIPRLEAVLADPSESVRLQAATALYVAGGEATLARSALVGLLRSEQAVMRRSAIQAIVALGPDGVPAVPDLEAMRGDADPEVRIESLRAVGRLQHW